MQSKRSWAFQPLLSCVILNFLLLVILYAMARQILTAFHQWVDPFLTPPASNLPAEAQSAFLGIGQLVLETEQYLAPAVFGLGMVVTLILWLVIKAQGHRLLDIHAERSQPTPAAVSTPEKERQADGSSLQEPLPSLREPPRRSSQTAVQMLAILQREGRLVDFLKEDLTPYTDDQIGAAVRSIHQGCHAALAEHLDLEPILSDVEGAEVTVPPGFDPQAIRLTGNVSGDPPFKGTLRHHGWRVLRVDLPQVILPQEKGWVLTPAEVEITD